MEVQEKPQQWPLRPPNTPMAVLAHRGLVGRSRENTLEAFADARAAGADGVELDVRLSASRTPVVLHDVEVPGLGPLRQLEDGALPGWLPTLADALAACVGAVVDVEIKASPAEPDDDVEALGSAVAELVAGALRTPGGPARAIVSSFWPAALQAVRAQRPELATGLLLWPAQEPSDGLALADELGAAVVLPFRAQVDAVLVERAHARSLAVWAWTVNEEEDLHAALGAGADAVITDHVVRAVSVLRRASEG
jgi:glycerophosphoryl diester phosphodiesterase